MASKLQYISQLADATLKKVTSNGGEWTKYLNSTAHLYRYPFNEQILIYGQRPDATACASFELWNEKMHRRVNLGAKGIALIDDNGGKTKLKHVFDISDTNAPPNVPMPYLWEMKDEYIPQIREVLNNSFGETPDTDSFMEFITDITNNAVQDNGIDYIEDFMRSRDNSLLEELDELNAEKYFTDLLKNSVEYTVYARLGYDVGNRFSHEEFSHISEFNTFETASILGSAASNISEMILMSIGREIKSIERQGIFDLRENFAKTQNVVHNKDITQNTERSVNHGTDLQGGGRLSDTELGTGGNDGNIRQVRDDAQDISERTQERNLQQPASTEQINGTLSGDRPDGTRPGTDNNRTNGAGAGLNGGTESQRPNVMVRPYEQRQSGGRRNRDKGNSLQLTLFPTVEQQQDIIEKAEGTEKSSAFSISQQIIDEVLCGGSNKSNSMLRICANYKKNKLTADNVEFLRNEYKSGGKGFYVNSEPVSVWFDEEGLRIAHGRTALHANDGVLVTWEQADKRIKELLNLGRYMPQSELDKVDGFELTDIAQRLWYLHQDRADGYVFSFLSEEIFKGGFPDSTKHIAELLSNPEILSKIIEGLDEFIEAYEQNPNLLRFHLHNPRELLKSLSDLQLESVVFTANEVFDTKSTMFITQDEIDNALAGGSNVSGSKFRIYSFFQETHTLKEKADFLRDEYGWGGSSHALAGANDSYANSDGKGLAFSRGSISAPYDKVTFSWSNVATRIELLIDTDRYLNASEKERFPVWQEQEEQKKLEQAEREYVRSILETAPTEKKEISRENAVYNISLGEAVYLGASKFEVLEYGDDKVRLFDEDFPIINKEYPREEFEKLLRENSRNDHLIAEPTETQTITMSFTPIADIPKADEIDTFEPEVIGEPITAELKRREEDADAVTGIVTEQYTPLFQKYYPLKIQQPENTIVMWMLGDFYEMYGEDAKAAADILDLQLMSRDNNVEKVEMCGIPKHIADEYAAKLSAKGYNVAITDSDQSGERYVSRVISANVQEAAVPIVETDTPSAGVPISKAVIDTFAKEQYIHYAKHDSGAIYISNGYYMLRTNQADFDSLVTQVNKRKRKSDIELVENKRILDHANDAKGTFELSQKPHELGDDKYTVCIYADNKQYFEYNKKFVDIFEGGESRFFVNDNTSYDIAYHGMIIKDRNNEVMGIILPINVPDELYERLADILPLEIPRKNELERIKENPTNDPYIGREFFDGRDNLIISGIRKINNEMMYCVPTVEDGKVSRSANLVKVEDIENQIERWEKDRVYREQQKLEDEIKAQKEALIKAEYEDTNGFADNLPPMNKARTLTTLNDNFFTKDYGNLSVKQFIRAAVEDGKTLEAHKFLKKKYTEIGINEYLNDLRWNVRSELWKRYQNVRNNSERADSPAAVWLKENHPFLHYKLFDDKTVLDESYFYTEYRVMMDDSKFYTITKTAYDYGNYLIDNPIAKEPQSEIKAETEHTPDVSEEQAAETVIEAETLTPVWKKSKLGISFPGEIETVTVKISNIPEAERNNFRITDDNLGHGGAKTKYGYNIAAIKLLKQLENENRLATPEEQEILSKYVGWGGLKNAFEDDNEKWANEYNELKGLLTEEEYDMARSSTLNAHYTSPAVIRAIYKAVENMGFKTGNILEPACGVGNFLGLLPDSMKDSKLYGVELDSITGRIAQQLYQKANIAVQGFEDTSHPDSFFDLSIGNVPFGGYTLADKRYDKHKFLIHDYFFAKTIDKTRPGGIIAFITSKGTLDKQNPEVRKYIAQRAELLGAIRLPNNAFYDNAGTEVTTDIIFLQKRDRAIDIDPDWAHLDYMEDNIPINRYFADNPEMVLGTMAYDDMMYGNARETTCNPFPDSNLSEQLNEAIQNIHADYSAYELDEQGEIIDTSIPADPNVRNFSFCLVDGQIYYRENSRMNKVDTSETAANRIKGMIAIRDCTRELIEYQTEDYSDSTIASAQKKLNDLYDSYTRKYGLLNSRGNNMAFSDDSSYPLLCSLEVLNEDGELERKADMFTKRTIRQRTSVTHVDTAVEALGVSIGERARVDIGFMQSLTGLSEEKIIQDLKGIIFLNPISIGENEPNQYLTADEYLSGNVREKLAIAKRSAELYPEDYTINVTALEAAQPKDLTASEIDVRLGTTWLPPKDIKDFMFELLEPPYMYKRDIDIFYSELTGNWNVKGKSADRSDNVKANFTFGTNRINAYKIIEESLNLRDVRIFDTVLDPDGNEKRVLNKKDTAIAQQKQEAIKEAFKSWIWKDPERRERLTKFYNEKFNSIRPREYNGEHIKFTGINLEITMRKHQIDGVARQLYGGNALLAHCVGAGKTFCMTAGAMESKHLGLCNKSMFVVPSHLTEQWGAEFLQLYPSANILVATKKDFEPKNRKKFCARIATGDYDAVIIGHSQFEKIPVSKERQIRLIKEEITNIVYGIKELKEQKGERYQIKQLEKTKKSLEARLKKLNDTSRKDDVVTFEELGIDRLYVDEADEFKNLFLYTKMRNVAGISTTDAQKSSDMYAKCRYIDELAGGKIVFATGTPISNSISEMYTMQRYLQYDVLQRNGLRHFDAWASTFGETVTTIELAPEGTGYRAKTRFAKFYNLPELMAMFKEVADIQTADMLKLPVPEADYQNISVKPSEFQKDMLSSLADRAQDVRDRKVKPHEDNMLRITNDGRKLALDQRLYDPNLPDFEGSKVNACIDKIFELWDENRDKRLTQLVFCDLSTPKSDGSFNVYDDIKSKLLERGIPADEISFIHEANTDVRKKELFAKVRKGQVRVLLGSTFKMGAGTNVQDLIIASHDLDCPWRPRDLEQRGGRTIRQGNKNPKVYMFRYVTENTFDAYMYQILENKQKFIGQIMTGKSAVRSAEDIDEAALSYAEVKALATDNPHIKEKMDLDIQVSKLKMLKSNHDSQIYELQDRLMKYYPRDLALYQTRIENYKNDIAVYEKHKPTDNEKFAGMTVRGISYEEKADAGAAIIEACKSMTDGKPQNLGEYMGFPMIFSFNDLNRNFVITLQGKLGHEVALGTDVHGNITRLNNELDGMSKKMEYAASKVAEIEKQIETAKEQVEIPFEKEDELTEKTARLAELNALLNMDDKTPEMIDETPEQEEQLTGLERAKRQLAQAR